MFIFRFNFSNFYRVFQIKNAFCQYLTPTVSFLHIKTNELANLFNSDN